MADDLVGYNPDDPIQQGFLSALALGETGGSSFAATEGVGGSNLAGTTQTDSYGFPIWTGLGNSHAAGTYQFQPGTWDSIAQKLGITSFSASNQDEAAWTLAEQTYQQKTGGNLEQALQAGQYGSIQSALSNIWPSVTGNQANPQGLGAILGSYISNASANGDPTYSGSSTAPTQGGASTSGGSTGSSGSSSGSGGFLSDLWGGVTNTFARGGLIVVGIVIVAAALWALLAERNIVPGPTKIVKGLIP